MPQITTKDVPKWVIKCDSAVYKEYLHKYGETELFDIESDYLLASDAIKCPEDDIIPIIRMIQFWKIKILPKSLLKHIFLDSLPSSVIDTVQQDFDDFSELIQRRYIRQEEIVYLTPNDFHASILSKELVSHVFQLGLSFDCQVIAYAGDLGLLKHVVKLQKKHHIMGSITRECVDQAASSGRLDILKYLIKEGWNVVYLDPRESRFVHQSDPVWCESTFDNAVSGGQLEVVKFLMRKGHKPEPYQIFNAAKHNRLECLKFFQDKIVSWPKKSSLVMARKNSVECLDYALAHGCSLEDDTDLYAISGDSLDCLKYLEAQKKNLMDLQQKRKQLKVAIKYNALKCFEYLLDHSGSAQDDLVLTASEVAKLLTPKTSLSIVQGLIARGLLTKPIPKSLFSHAIKHSSIELMCFCLRQGHKFSDQDVKLLIRKNKLDLLLSIPRELLYLGPKAVQSIFEYASRSKKSEFLCLLKTNAAPLNGRVLIDEALRKGCTELLDKAFEAGTKCTSKDRLQCITTHKMKILRHILDNPVMPPPPPHEKEAVFSILNKEVDHFQYLCQEGAPIDKNCLLLSYAEKDSVYLPLLEQHCPSLVYTLDSLKLAILCGRLPLVKKITKELRIDPIECEINLCSQAAHYGQFNCLKFFHKKVGFPLDTDVLEDAVLSGSLDCLDYLLQAGVGPLTADLFANVTKVFQDSKVMELLLKHGCPWDAQTCAMAAASGNISGLTFAHSQGCPWDIRTTIKAAEFGHSNCMNYAVKNGCPWDPRAYYLARLNDHSKCLEDARTQGCKRFTRRKGATFEYLHADGRVTSYPSIDAFEANYSKQENGLDGDIICRGIKDLFFKKDNLRRAILDKERSRLMEEDQEEGVEEAEEDEDMEVDVELGSDEDDSDINLDALDTSDIFFSDGETDNDKDDDDEEDDDDDDDDDDEDSLSC